ncbi:hypothetical protein AB205_0116360 [Aquarana catesbeiana]|uniref:Uncharacterized protein n=1 Tax=Aquarana catesbeiana TaxID=8400 RepID=A0A2G9Q2H0_AQUCT|nr:hypothetical protein AB205_0116360 [Aquarana catesbeiana]
MTYSRWFLRMLNRLQTPGCYDAAAPLVSPTKNLRGAIPKTHITSE